MLEHTPVTGTRVASVECVLSYSKEVEVFIGQLGMAIGYEQLPREANSHVRVD